jgi:hypothetical protein
MINDIVTINSNVEPGEEFKLDILIPTFNRQEKLIRTILSLYPIKAFHKIHIVILDNNSSGYDYHHINRILAENKEIKYSFYRNQSTVDWASNWNRAVELSVSSRFMFLHDDDTMTSRFVNYISKLDLYNSRLKIFQHNIIYENKTSSTKVELKNHLRRILILISRKKTNIKIECALLYVPSIIGAIFDKKSYKLLGGVSSSIYSSDYELILNYIKSFGGVKYKFTLINYYMGENTSSKEGMKDLLASEALNIRNEFLKGESLNPLISRLIMLIYRYEKGETVKITERLMVNTINILNYLNVI